jgi:hypothetical protein
MFNLMLRTQLVNRKLTHPEDLHNTFAKKKPDDYKTDCR